MIAKDLETCLQKAFTNANQARHEFITVEHLLLAILDEPTVVEALKACNADFDLLRGSLNDFIRDNTPVVPGTKDMDTQPTLGFQRVIQRAIMHAQSASSGAGKDEVTGATVLASLFGEKDAHAVYFLHQQGITRLDVVNFIAHGIRKDVPKEAEKATEGAEETPTGSSPDKEESPLERYTHNLNKAAESGTIDR